MTFKEHSSAENRRGNSSYYAHMYPHKCTKYVCHEGWQSYVCTVYDMLISMYSTPHHPFHYNGE